MGGQNKGREGGFGGRGRVEQAVDWACQRVELAMPRGGIGHSSAGWILSPGPNPASIPWAAQICALEIIGANSPVGLTGTQHRVKGKNFPNSKFHSSPHLPCTGYNISNTAFNVLVQVRIVTSHDPLRCCSRVPQTLTSSG